MIHVPTMIVVGASNDAPFNSFREMLAYAKTNPGKISYGTSGLGTSHHLALEQINLLAGTNIVHIPYKGGPEILTDMLGGRLSMAFIGISFAGWNTDWNWLFLGVILFIAVLVNTAIGKRAQAGAEHLVTWPGPGGVIAHRHQAAELKCRSPLNVHCASSWIGPQRTRDPAAFRVRLAGVRPTGATPARIGRRKVPVWLSGTSAICSGAAATRTTRPSW